MEPEPGASFYTRMAERLEAEGLRTPADRMHAVARMLSWQPKPEQTNPMYRPVDVDAYDPVWRDLALRIGCVDG